jgi:ABC-2 type transport system ATP-binding protein
LQHAIHTHGLTKHYGRYVALRDLDLRVPAGALYGFLGPNGSGKTTAIRLLLGLLRATRGQAEVLGQQAWRDGPRLRRAVGYLAGDVRLYDHMTGHRTIRFVAAAHERDVWPEARRLAGALDLDLDKRVRNYSRGMKQKLGLIVALMHRPALLVLDEPTTALDPLVREALFTELRSVVADGRTVLFSSHTLAEVDALCDHVAILRRGRLIEQERMDVLRGRAVRHVELRTQPGSALPDRRPAGLELHATGPDFFAGAWSGPVADLLAWLHEARVADVTIAAPDLEDLFMAYYNGGGDAS